MSIFDVHDGESESDVQNALENFKEYVSTEIDDLFETPSKKWYVKYEPLDSSKEYRIHPGADIVEAYPLSFVKPPLPNDDEIKIPDNGELTTVQMDALRLASARFKETFAETGITKGFLLADGPGLGKTRILAAIIYNEFLKGYKRHIFLSISDILFQDVISEFAKIASEDWANAHVHTLEQLGSTLRLQDFEGVLLMTYHRLRKSGATGATPSLISRLSGIDVIKNFCRKERPFQGVIALDESHVGKNALNPIVDLRSTTGQMLLKVLDIYKNGKVIYSTATPASTTNHFGIMTRLGIWGPEKYFSEFEKFDKLMSKWELSAAELMALKLKQEGGMVCRQISFEGVDASATYVPVDSEPQGFRENYDKFSDMWRRMYKDIGIIASYCDADSKRTKIATFFSALLNFFRALIIDSKINHLVHMIVKEIEEDHVVVVGIQGTGESSYADCKKNEERETLISNAKEIMEKLVKNHFCVAMHSKKQKRNDDEGDDCSDTEESNNGKGSNEINKSSTIEEDLYLSSSDTEEDGEETVPLIQGHHAENENQPARGIVYEGTKMECADIPEVHKIRNDWLEEIGNIQNMPPNFLDEIRRRLLDFNSITVAEITGRRQQLIKKDGGFELVDRPIDCDLERKLFMEGKANVAIISDAGSTGISLHASEAKENYSKKLRVHITVELGWSAEKVLQQLGRTNRANQRQPPRYIFLLSNVPAEIRFTSIILGRLATMSTFTCAQRHVDLCDRLEEQAKYDSNAGIRGIRAALAFFFDEDVPVSYKKDVHLKHKVASQLNFLGLSTSKKEKNSFVKAQGRTLKRINLTKVMNKLLGCSLDVQEVFCDVWLFYLTHFRQQYNKDQGVVVVHPNVCTVLVDKDQTTSLHKHDEKEGVVKQLGSSRLEQQQSDHDESSDENDSSNVDSRIRPVNHGPINLLKLHVCLGSRADFIKNLYEAAPKSDKISGFYYDANFPRLNKLRYFYLQNKQLTEQYQQQLFNKEELPQDLLEQKLCVLYQPHQPPIELTGEETVEFLNCMAPVLMGSVALKQWFPQASALKDVCIHKYSLGLEYCESPSCSRGKRHDLKCIVTGDLPAIWPDIVSILHDEDPLVVVCKEANTGIIHVGIEIPKHAITSLQMKIANQAYYTLGA